MEDFTFFNPTKIVFGKSAMSQIGVLAKTYGNKVLVTYGGGSIKKNGVYEKVMEQLKGFEVREFSGIEPNPRVETVRRCLAENKDFQPDLVLAVGGGSVIDASKLLVSAWNYDGDAWDFLVNPGANPSKYIPLAVVLTMSATGSEMNCGSVVTNWTEHLKLFFNRTENYPKFSILDPQNLYSLPSDQTAYGVIDAFSHILEQYITTSEDVPLQDRWSEGVLFTLKENALQALKEPKEYKYRANIMFSAAMALNGLVAQGTAQDWATHNIEHELSAFYDIPHAGGLAIITPRWMKVVAIEQKLRKMAQYGRRIWGLTGEDDKVVAAAAIDQTYAFFKSLGIKMSLKELNIDNSHFPEMIDRLVNTPTGEIQLTKEQISEILNACLE